MQIAIRVTVRAAVQIALGVATAVATTVPLRAAADPAAVFQKKCTSCHTFGKGDLVGPDLKGVTARRTRPWLQAWIRSSARTIESGDRTAVALFSRYKQQRMPDQALTAEDVEALLNYLAAGGPDSDRRSHIRSALTATSADVERGRDLFEGALPLASGASACVSCHTVRDGRATGGASFGGDLSHAYSRFQDTALSIFFQRPCYPRVTGVEAGAQLNDNEAFAVKAFLRRVDIDGTRSSGGGGR